MSKKEKDLINELVDFALNYNVDYIYILEEIKNLLDALYNEYETLI